MYTLDSVRVQYRYTHCLFQSITITPSGITHVVGDNGSGKSTLLKVLSGLVSPHAGILRYKGEVITKKTRSILHKESTLLLQNNYLFNRTVRDNLAYPLKVRKEAYGDEDLIHALSQVGLSSILLDKYPYELSGGERQRVAIAVRLLVESSVLLLDEPVASVDKTAVIIIQELLKEIAKHTKIVIVAHNALWAEQLATQTIAL
ncbi:MAG: ATP-binding cassette domain-containing protein [Desulfovibrionaceae bacterium]|nr:ATP-binding cassette domain-containing protein [Desulfovibrionaceae bacterium]